LTERSFISDISRRYVFVSLGATIAQQRNRHSTALNIEFGKEILSIKEAAHRFTEDASRAASMMVLDRLAIRTT
jgi:hypothetical protein